MLLLGEVRHRPRRPAPGQLPREELRQVDAVREVDDAQDVLRLFADDGLGAAALGLGAVDEEPAVVHDREGHVGLRNNAHQFDHGCGLGRLWIHPGRLRERVVTRHFSHLAVRTDEVRLALAVKAQEGTEREREVVARIAVCPDRLVLELHVRVREERGRRVKANHHALRVKTLLLHRAHAQPRLLVQEAYFAEHTCLRRIIVAVEVLARQIHLHVLAAVQRGLACDAVKEEVALGPVAGVLLRTHDKGDLA